MVDYNIEDSVCLKCMLVWFLSCLYSAVSVFVIRCLYSAVSLTVHVCLGKKRYMRRLEHVQHGWRLDHSTRTHPRLINGRLIPARCSFAVGNC